MGFLSPTLVGTYKVYRLNPPPSHTSNFVHSMVNVRMGAIAPVDFDNSNSYSGAVEPVENWVRKSLMSP